MTEGIVNPIPAPTDLQRWEWDLLGVPSKPQRPYVIRKWKNAYARLVQTRPGGTFLDASTRVEGTLTLTLVQPGEMGFAFEPDDGSKSGRFHAYRMAHGICFGHKAFDLYTIQGTIAKGDTIEVTWDQTRERT